MENIRGVEIRNEPSPSYLDKYVNIIKKIFKLKTIYITEGNAKQEEELNQNEEDEFDKNVFNLFGGRDNEEAEKNNQNGFNLKGLDTSREIVKKNFEFNDYQNFGKFLLNVLTDLISLDFCFEIEGKENLQKKTNTVYKAKFCRISCLRLRRSLVFVKKIDNMIKNYLNWKLHNWESILFTSSQVKKLICRICENEFILQDFIIHLCLCKKKEFYNRELQHIKKTLSSSINKLLNDLEQEVNSNFYENIFSSNSKFHKDFFKQISDYNVRAKLTFI